MTLSDDIRALHTPTEGTGEHLRCMSDGQRWPCPTIELVHRHEAEPLVVQKWGWVESVHPDRVAGSPAAQFAWATGDVILTGSVEAGDPIERFKVMPDPMAPTTRCSACEELLHPLRGEASPKTCDTPGCWGNLAAPTPDRPRRAKRLGWLFRSKP